MADSLQDALDKCKRAAAAKLQALAHDIPYQKASIQLLNGDFRSLFVAQGFQEDEASRILLRPICSDRLVERIFASETPCFIADTSTDGDWKQREETRDVKAWIGAPILHDSRRVGFLTLDFCETLPRIKDFRRKVTAFVTAVTPMLAHACLLDGHKRLERDMTIVRNIVKIIGEKLDPEELLEEIVQQIANHLNCTHCTIFFPKKIDGKLMLVPQHAGGSHETKTRIFRANEGLAGWVFKNGKTVVVSSAAQDKRFAEARGDRPAAERSMLVVPIKVGDQTIGVISADQDIPGWFSDSDANLLEALGQQAGIAMQRSQALTLLQAIATRILTQTKERDILEQIVHGAIELVNATTGVIYWLDPSGKTVEKEYSPPEFRHPPPRLDNPNAITSTVIRRGEPVRVANVRTATDVSTNPALHGVYESMIAVPLKIDKRVVGVFFVDDEEEHVFTDTEESLLLVLASHAVIAIQKTIVFEDLQIRIRRHEVLEKQLNVLTGLAAGQEPNVVDKVLDLMGEGIRAIFGEAVTPTINLLNPDTRNFEPPRAYGPLCDALREQPRREGEGGTGQYVLEKRTPLYLPDVTSPPPGVPTIRRASVELGVKSFAAIPLMLDKRVLGVLFVNSTESLAFSEPERAALESFAGQAAQVIEKYRLPESVTVLRKKAFEFFKSAGRKSAEIVGSLQLKVPEPVRVAAGGVASVDDVSGLEQLLQPEHVGYFVFSGKLSRSTEDALDDLRIRRNPIVALSEDTMTAAIADGKAEAVLVELEFDYRSKENLFEMRSALKDERFLFGRRNLLAAAGESLSNGEHLLLFGLRKSGKTSFLNILRQHLSKHPVSHIDLQQYDRRNQDWPPLLFQHIVSSYDTWGRAVFSKDWPGRAPAIVANASEFHHALRQRREWQVQRGSRDRFVVVLDEVERVFRRDLGGEEAHRFVQAAGALRALAQEIRDPFVSIIAADLRSDVNRTNGLSATGTNPFFEFFKEVPLPLLAQQSLTEMVSTIGRAMGVKKVESEFVQKLFEQTGGHPFLSRLVSAAAYRKSNHVLDERGLSEGLREMRDLNIPGFFFEENLWSALRSGERDFLLEHVGSASPKSKRSVAVPIDKASLVALGLLKNDRIPIGLFDTWLREVKLAPKIESKSRV